MAIPAGVPQPPAWLQYVAVEEVEDEAGCTNFEKESGGEDVAVAVDEVEAAEVAADAKVIEAYIGEEEIDF